MKVFLQLVIATVFAYSHLALADIPAELGALGIGKFNCSAEAYPQSSGLNYQPVSEPVFASDKAEALKFFLLKSHLELKKVEINGRSDWRFVLVGQRNEQGHFDSRNGVHFKMPVCSEEVGFRPGGTTNGDATRPIR